MIDAGRLLADLKKLRKKLEEDLRSHHRVSEQRAAIEFEWREALNTKCELAWNKDPVLEWAPWGGQLGEQN